MIRSIKVTFRYGTEAFKLRKLDGSYSDMYFMVKDWPSVIRLIVRDGH